MEKKEEAKKDLREEIPWILQSEYFIAGDHLGSLLAFIDKKTGTETDPKSQKWLLLIDRSGLLSPSGHSVHCSTRNVNTQVQ